MVAANPQKLMGSTKTVQSAVIQPQQQMIAAPADTAALRDISKSLARITQLLTQQNSQVTAEANQERKNQENAKRKKVELGLENSFAAVKNVAQAVVAPVKNILDQIIQFFVTLFLGKAILNLIDWFSKKENQDKIRSIARFLQTFWPALVAAYILFGTGFGRVVRNLAGIGLSAIKGLGGITLKLIGAIAKATGFKKAGALMSGLGGGGGLKGLAARLLTGAAVAGGTALVAKNMMGGEDAPQVAVPEPASLPVAEAFGGGLIDFKTMLAASGGQVDSKLGIFAQLFGSGGFAGLMNNVPGVVIGPKGIDKVPAMLTDGEFVMSRGAVQKFGVSNLEAMNAAGGGTNKPKIVQKRIHAYGGGYITSTGREDSRANYDKKHGEGSYTKKLAEKRAKSDSEDDADIARRKMSQSSNNRPAKSSGQKKSTGDKKITVNDINVTGLAGLATGVAGSTKGMGPNVTVTRNAGPDAMRPDMQRKLAEENKKSSVIDASRARQASIDKKARSEYAKIINNPNDPRYDAAWNGNLKVADIRKQLQAKASATPSPQSAYGVAGMGNYSAANVRRAQSAAGVGVNVGAKMFGDPSNAARSGYAASKGKYYSSSDQKTYASENDALAAKKSRMTSLASQQGLDKLSNKGAGPRSGLGVRAKAESASRREDFEKRGGLGGQIGRGFTRMFGGGDQISKLDQQDKAATTKVKQAGASSIGRYYSSSDGKYYKDYNAASKAKKARLATTPVKGKPITPTPKPAPKVYNPGGGAMGGGRGGSGGGSKGTRIPSIPTGKDNRKTANQLNIK